MQNTDYSRNAFLYADAGMQLLLLVYWLYTAGSAEYERFFYGLSEQLNAWLLVTGLWQIFAGALHWRYFSRAEYRNFVRYSALALGAVVGAFMATIFALYFIALFSVWAATWSLSFSFFLIAYGHWLLLPIALWGYYLLILQLYRRWFDYI